MKSETGQVTKIISNRYTVKCQKGGTYVAHARGKIKLQHEIYVGDFVKFYVGKPFSVIDEILPRKNSLVRPYVANVDAVLILISYEPEPDMILADKILVNCYKENITPILCYNKADLASHGEAEATLKPYAEFVDCLAFSALSGSGINEIERHISGNLVALAGQSAVGKTSLLNKILSLNLQTGELSAKILRGKNTTRHIEIFDALGGKIIDTCGFSVLEVPLVEKEELRLYYHEFTSLKKPCKYVSCCHVDEPLCAVKEAVESGEIDKGRYERYLHIYNELKEKRKF
jgi:ribosome biogenesis GTPase